MVTVPPRASIFAGRKWHGGNCHSDNVNVRVLRGSDEIARRTRSRDNIHGKSLFAQQTCELSAVPAVSCRVTWLSTQASCLRALTENCHVNSTAAAAGRTCLQLVSCAPPGTIWAQVSVAEIVHTTGIHQRSFLGSAGLTDNRSSGASSRKNLDELL